MRALLALAVLLVTSASFAQSPQERDYLARRDAAIATVTAREKEPDYSYDGAKYKELRGDLEMRLRRIIGSVAPPKGFAGAGEMSPDILCCGLGEGRLDGIAFSDANDQVVVTTEGLLSAWLERHRTWWPNLPPMPSDPSAAFASDAFYTQAMITDAHVEIFAPLPVTVPAGARIAVVRLVLLSQAGPLWPPKQIAAGVIKDGRVRVGLVEATTKPAVIAACDAVLKESQAKVAQAFAENKSDVATRLQDQGFAAFEKCWAERVRDEPAFPAIMRQAQSLVDALAAN